MQRTFENGADDEDVDPHELQEALLKSLRLSSSHVAVTTPPSSTVDGVEKISSDHGVDDSDIDPQVLQEVLVKSLGAVGRTRPAVADVNGDRQLRTFDDSVNDVDQRELQEALAMSMGVGTSVSSCSIDRESTPRRNDDDDSGRDDDVDAQELQDALAMSLRVDRNGPSSTDGGAATPSANDDQNLDLQAALLASSLEDQNRLLLDAERLTEEARTDLRHRPQSYERAYMRYRLALNLFVEHGKKTRAAEILYEMSDVFGNWMWVKSNGENLDMRRGRDLENIESLLLFVQRYDMALQCSRRAYALYRSEGSSLGTVSLANDALFRLEDIAQSAGLSGFTEWGLHCLRVIDYSNVLPKLDESSLLLQSGRAEEALQLLWSVLSWSHENQVNLLLPLVHFRFAYLLQSTKALDEALSHYNQVCRLLPEAGLSCFSGHARYSFGGDQSLLFAQANHFIGTIWQSKGEFRQALDYYERALHVKQRMETIEKAVTHNNIASVYMDWASRTKTRHLERRVESSLREAEQTLYALIEQNAIPPWHPEMIYCKYNLAVIAVKDENYMQTLELAEYIITHLPKYKWAYTVKAEALVKMNVLDEALSVYDMVLGQAPNYADAVKARLQVLMEKKKAITRKQSKTWEEEEELQLLDVLISSSLQAARDLQLDAGDEIDHSVRSDFQSTNSASAVVNPHGAETQVPSNQITDMDTLLLLVQEISAKQDQTLQGINVVQQQAQDIVRKTDEVLEAQRIQTESILEIKAGQAKSQAVLSYLIDGENLPCPKLVLMVPKTKTSFFSIRRFVNEPFRPFKRKWKVFFACERTLKIANPEKPMEIELTVRWLRQLAPLVKASLVAFNIACRIGGLPLPPLPFPNMGLMDNIEEFQTMVQDHCALDDDTSEILEKMEEWAEENSESLSLTDRNVSQMQRLTDSSYRSFSEIALQKRECWFPFMERVVDGNRLIWVCRDSRST